MSLHYLPKVSNKPTISVAIAMAVYLKVLRSVFYARLNQKLIERIHF